MTRVEIEGKTYWLRFDLVAMEAIEEEFGGVEDLFEAMKGKKRIPVLRSIFRIMANSGASYKGLDEDVTGQEIMRMTMPEMTALMAQIQDEVRGARRSKIAEKDREAPNGAILDASEEDDEDAEEDSGDNEKNG